MQTTSEGHAAAPLPVLGRWRSLRAGSACHRITRDAGRVLLAARCSRPRPPCQGRAALRGIGLCGRVARLDTSVTARGMAATRRTGRSRGWNRGIGPGQRKNRWAIGGPLTPVTRGLSRVLTDCPLRRSGRIQARMAQIPKLIVRQFSPAD
jgi:hypothetical protein